jgi:hypothetical protein
LFYQEENAKNVIRKHTNVHNVLFKNYFGKRKAVGKDIKSFKGNVRVLIQVADVCAVADVVFSVVTNVVVDVLLLRLVSF